MHFCRQIIERGQVWIPPNEQLFCDYRQVALDQFHQLRVLSDYFR